MFRFALLLCISLLWGQYLAGQEIAIDKAAIQRHAEFLASDSLGGRATGSPGEQIAADYLAECFRQYNLEPVGDNGTFYQKIQLHGSTPSPQSELLLYKDNDTTHLNLNSDYLLFKYGAQTLVPQPVELVFVGYGIVAPEFDYNDYLTLDVHDKIVVYLAGEPYSSDPFYFAGTEPTIYAYPEAKERTAISRGARGSILLPNPNNSQYREWQHYVNSYAFEDITLAYAPMSHLSLIINPDKADILFQGSGVSLADIYTMDQENTIKSFPLQLKLSFKGQFTQRDFISHNVLAMLYGNDPEYKHSYIIVTAHYDHLGIGTPVLGDSIYNGFGDNALGCAGALELARMLAQTRVCKRSVLFLMDTGEEKGLLGSTFYIDHPVVPLHQTIANINIDGLAMFDEFNDIVGVGYDLSDLDKILHDVAEKMDLRISPIPSQFLRSESFARSDQISFAKAGIPAILIMDGLNYKHLSLIQGLQMHLNWMSQTYHSPFDDKDQTLNYDATVQHCRVLYNVIVDLANASKEIHWKPGSPYINARLQTIAEKR